MVCLSRHLRDGPSLRLPITLDWKFHPFAFMRVSHPGEAAGFVWWKFPYTGIPDSSHPVPILSKSNYISGQILKR
jgi:hypothetical protein